MRGMLARWLPAPGLLVLLFLVVPVFPIATISVANSQALSIAGIAAATAVVTLATAMFIHLTGLPTVATAGFWAIGAYASAISMSRWDFSFWLSFIFAIAAAVVIAIPVGLLCLRASGMGFLILTLALSQFIVIVIQSTPEITNGFSGIIFQTASPLELGPLDLTDGRDKYYFCLLVLAVVVGLYGLLRTSKLGRRALSIRDNPALAQSLGINVRRHNFVLFLVSSAVAAAAGPVTFLQVGVLTPGLFDTYTFLGVYVMAILGGVGTLVGPVVGTWIIKFLPQWLSETALASPNYQVLIYGLLLIICITFVPDGISGGISRLAAWLRSRRGPARRPESKALDREQLGLLEALHPRPASGEDLVEVVGLEMLFGANRALDGVDFVVKRGEILGVIGPNGSGKTTTLNCLSGFLAPTRGSMRICGVDVRGAAPDAIARLALVRTFQQPETFSSMTVRESLDVVALAERSLWQRSASHDQHLGLDELLEVAQLGDLDQNVTQLSYGQSRLLGVVLAALRKPKVLLLDEPAAGLSMVDGSRLRSLLLQLSELGVTIIVIDHDMTFLLPIVDRLIALDSGRKIADGDPESVCSDPAVIEAYFGTELPSGSPARGGVS